MEAVLRQAIAAYRAHGPRSNKKVSVIHEYIGNRLRAVLPAATVHCLPGKEYRLQGHFLKKAVDVCVIQDQRVLGVVSLKFFMSNHAQNAVNYAEQLMGEMVNLTGLNDPIVRWCVTITFDDIPYLDKSGQIKRYERFKHSDVYTKLVEQGYLDVFTLMLINNGRGLLEGPLDAFTLKEPEAFETGLEAFVSQLTQKLA